MQDRKIHFPGLSKITAENNTLTVRWSRGADAVIVVAGTFGGATVTMNAITQGGNSCPVRDAAGDVVSISGADMVALPMLPIDSIEIVSSGGGETTDIEVCIVAKV